MSVPRTFFMSVVTCVPVVLIVTVFLFIQHALFLVDSFRTRIHNAHSSAFALRRHLMGSQGRCVGKHSFILCRISEL